MFVVWIARGVDAMEFAEDMFEMWEAQDDDSQAG
jgi:hypothetical protein